MLCVLFALATAGVAAAANGGFTPVKPESPNASHTQTAYYVILGFTSAIFILVEGLLVAFIWKYRARGRARAVEGAQVHGHTRLELIWTVIPVLILGAIAGFIFANLPGIADVPASSNRLDVRVIGHQFYWEFRYPGGQVSINSLHVPVNRVVYLRISSPDVNHSWWVPRLGGKTDAIPGRTNHTWFDADQTGSFRGQCAELCGGYHAAMQNKVIVTDEAAYRQYLARTPKNLGRNIFNGVCITCHGIGGKGGYGPPLKGNPLTAQPSAIEQIVRHGRMGTIGIMPPVGRGWTAAEVNALTSFLKKNLGGASGS